MSFLNKVSYLGTAEREREIYEIVNLALVSTLNAVKLTRCLISQFNEVNLINIPLSFVQ